MASRGQTQGDLVAGSVSVPHTTKNINTGPSLSVTTHDNTDRHVPLPFMPLHVSPFQVGGSQRNQECLSSASSYDLNIPFDMNCALDHNLLFANNFPLLDYQVSDFPSTEFDMTMNFGAPSNMMNSYHAGNVFPRLERTSDANTVSFSSPSGSGVGNFHMTPLPQETQSNRNFSAFRRPNSDIVSGAYDNQVRVNVPPIDNVVRLDGRFLSLGCQSNSLVNAKSTAFKGIPSHMCDSPFSPSGQLGNYSHDSMGGRLAGFQNNVHDLGTPSDISGSLTLAQSDRRGFQATTFAFDVPPVPILPTGQVNMERLMPTRRKMSEFRKETDSRVSSSDPSERRMQRVRFDSSVLRSNHQHAADQLQRSYVRTNKVLPLPLEIGGGIVKQGKSGNISLSNEVSYVGAGENCKMSDNRVPQSATSANKGASVTLKNQHFHSSAAVAREPPKRNLESPQQDMMQYQRRKIMAQSSSHPFSSHLLQNALGQISSGPPMPLFPTSARSPLKGLVSSDTTINPAALPAASRAGAFISSTQISEISSAIPSSVISSPTAFANNSGPMLTPVPAFAPPTLMHPSISASPAALARTVTRRTGVARIPVTASRRAVSHSPSTVSAPRKTSMSHTNSSLKSPALASIRKSSHGLTTPAKPSPPYAALQSPPTVPHIKWQVSDAPPTLGFKCMLCKRDLSYAPEGPVSVPRIPPPIAVLPCGHTFHDHCLLLITSDDQSKDPPCIPCAIGDN